MLDPRNHARAFAVRAHGDQTYGDAPYVVHLDAVAAIAAPFGETAEVVAFLHDVVEDTDVPLTEIEAEFGALVAQCVAILTDEDGADRAERKRKTYAKMARVEGELELALIVKAADRLANVRQGEKNEMYRREHPTFTDTVHRKGLCDEIWKELDERLSA